jgi:hypothetical protein
MCQKVLGLCQFLSVRSLTMGHNYAKLNLEINIKYVSELRKQISSAKNGCSNDN